MISTENIETSKENNSNIQSQNDKNVSNSTNLNQSQTNQITDELVSQSYLSQIKNIINEVYYFLTTIPLFCRLLIGINLTLMILTTIFPIKNYIANKPTILLYNLWTIITGPFVPSHFINCAVCLFFLIPKAKSLEKSLSTIRYMINFFIDLLFTTILFNIIIILLDLDWSLNGLLAITICQNTLLCMANPDVKLSFIIEIEAKYYPLLLYIIMFTAHLGKALDIGVGLIYAVIYFYLLKIQISDELAAKFEKIFMFCSYFSCFVSVSDATGSGSSGKSLNISTSSKVNKEEVVEKLDKSTDRNGNKFKEVNYINLEDDKTL